jgi:uncharacterized protein involved in outer membrane biogenesis
MRRILIGTAIAVVLLLVALVAIVSLVDVNKYRPRIQAELQTKLGRAVTLGQLHLRVLPLSVRIDGVTIAEAPAFQSTLPFAKADEVYVSAHLFSLLSGNPSLKSVQLTKPRIELIRNAQGVWNFSTLGGTSGTSTNNKQSGGGLTLAELSLSDGQIGITDYLNHEPRTVYDHIDAKLTDFAPDKRFGVELAVHLPGKGKELASLKADVGPLKDRVAADIPIDGRFSLEEVSLAGFSHFAAGAIPDKTDATISGSGTLKSQNQNLAAQGHLKFADAVVRGVNIGYPIEADYDLTDDRRQSLIQVRSARLKLGSTPFSIGGQVNGAAKPTTVNLRIVTTNASITELARLAGATGVALSPNYKIDGKLNADVTITGPLNAPQLNGTLAANQLEASGGEIKQPVTVPTMSLALSPNSIQSNTFVARSGSTQVNTTFSLGQYSGTNPLIDATVKTSGANVAEVLNMAKAYGVEAAQGLTGTGVLSLDAHVQGPLKNSSQMNYSGSANLSNVSLSSPTLSKPIAIRTANVRFAQNGASFDGLSAAIGSTNLQGNLSAKNFSSPEVQFALSADKIDVAELQQLRTTTKAPPAGGGGKPSAPAEPSLLSKTSGQGTLAANSIVSQNFVLNNVRTTVRLDHGLITLSPLTANIFNGSEAGSIVLDTRPATSTCAVKAKFTGVDTNQLLSAVSSVKNRLYGSLAADTNVSFAVGSGPDLTRTLNGVLGLNVTNGRLEGINILQQVSAIGKFLGTAPAQNATNTELKKLSGTLDIKNGVASTNDLAAVLDAGSLSARGILNLVDQGVNMHLTAVLSSGVSQSVGGAKVGGYLNTALANNKGELVIPVVVTGSMAKPSFAPDVNALAEMKMKNMLPTSLDPGKLGSVLGGSGSTADAVNSILGGGAKQQGGNATQKSPQTTDDLVNSVLGQFGKKKKPPK